MTTASDRWGAAPGARFGTVRRLNPGDTQRLDALLSDDPIGFVYPLGWLRRDGIVPSVPYLNFHYSGLFESGELTAASLLAGDTLLFLATHDTTRAAALAARLTVAGAGFKVLVGPRAAVEAAWQVFEARGFEARLARDQVVLTVSRDQLQAQAPCELRVAERTDLEELLSATLAMHLHETLESVSGDDVSVFERTLEYQIAMRRVYAETGPSGLRFKASVSALCAAGAQIEGVWVPPEHRGKGHARRGLGQLCELLLRSVERVSLYVNEDNSPAINLYVEALGFRRALAFKTIFLRQSGC